MRGRKLFVLSLLLAMAVQVQACILNVKVEASSDQGTAWREFTAVTSDYQSWQIENPVSIESDGELFGVIDKLIVRTIDDPEVSLEFGVRAQNQLTTFHLTIEPLDFDAIYNPDACASAGVSLTDRSASTPGATMKGLFNGNIFRASYNGGSVFTDIVSTLSTTGPAPSTKLANGELCGVINGPVSNINLEAYFTLTPNDSASGTATFSVVPEPATMAMLGLGSVSFLLRRKK